MFLRTTMIFLSILISLGCGKKEDPKTTGGSSGSFPEAFTTSFMKGCVSSATANDAVSKDMAQRYCTCALNEVEANFTIEQVMKAMEASGGDVPEEMVAVMEPCVKKILGGGDSKTGGEAKPTEKTAEEAAKSGAYPEGVRTAYLDSCVGGAASMGDKAKPYCTCTLNKIEKKYSLQEFVDLASKMKGGDLPDEFMVIVKSCL